MVDLQYEKDYLLDADSIILEEPPSSSIYLSVDYVVRCRLIETQYLTLNDNDGLENPDGVVVNIFNLKSEINTIPFTILNCSI